MQTVACKIVLGSTTLRSDSSSHLVSVETQAAFPVPVHRCRIVLDGTATVNAQAGAEVQVELGYDKTLSRVFTGQVQRIESGLTHIRIEALSVFAALTAARINQVYEKQSAQEIVQDLLGKADVKQGKLETGVKFASYTVSASRSAWAHLNSLAEQCGFDLYADVEDRAVFAAYQPSRTHDFQYGKHILDYSWEQLPPSFVGVEVNGESPAGQGESDDASPWLTKKEVKGSAGQSSGHVLRLVEPTARTQDLAREMADNRWQRSKVEASGQVRLIGAPAVALGDAIQLAQMPVSAHNGVLRVTGVRHRLTPSRGFVTDVSWEKSGQ